MATTRELQEQNRVRQTGQIPVEIAPPPIRKIDTDGKIVETPFPIDQQLPTGRDLFGQINMSNMNYAGQAEVEGYGQDRRDVRSGYQPGANLEDIRAREQSWGSKVLNGSLKGLLTAGTTYANTTFGFAASVGAALYGFTPFGQMQRNGLAAAIPFNENQEFPTAAEAIQAGVNNELSQKLVALQQLGEQWFPNFRTEEEQSEKYQREWYKHLLTGNTIGDAFLKNFGFTVGAMLGAGSWQKILGKKAASELAKDTMMGVAVASEGDAAALTGMTNAADAIKRGAVLANGNALINNVRDAARRSVIMPLAKQLEFGVISAMGEGNAEGLMARDEYLQEALPEVDRWFQEQYDALEDQVLNSYEGNRQKVFVEDENGEPIEKYVLTEEGREALLNRQNQLFEDYRNRREYVMQQADELSATTFGLNIPILTVSHLAQFSKMLGGGWRSARSVAGRARGALVFDAAGNPVANYAERNVGRAIAKGATGLLRTAGAEGGEEMAQGFVSSGAKNVANDKLTYFNDMSYDRQSLDAFRQDWWSSMVEGGEEYLRDPKNWQEGFLGALTGLFGMPGPGYFRGERGGLPQAIVDTRNEVSAMNGVGRKLNQLVNSKDFQERWKGYIRHLAFDDQIKDAVNRDDEYLFHWADDSQLFNDVMTFAKAGRLDDLEAVADRFSNLSQDDIADVREQLKQNNQPNTDRDSEIKDRVEKQAKNIKKYISDYGEIRDMMAARLPIGASDDLIDEMVFTGFQINNAEERFLDLLNKTLNSLDAVIGAKINKPKDSAEFTAELNRIKDKYFKIFSGSLVSLDADTRKVDDAALDRLEKLVKNDKTLAQQVSDMRKLYRDRQRFYDKFTKLENITNEEFAAVAQNQEKTVAEAEKQAAVEEVASLNSLADVKNEYNREKKRNMSYVGAFINRMRTAKDTNPNVAAFLDIFDAYDDLRNIYTRVNGKPDALVEDMIDNVFNKSTNRGDMINPRNIDSFEQYQRRINDMFDTRKSGALFEEMLNQRVPQMEVSEETYNAAYNKVVDAMNALGGIQSSTEGRQAARQTPPAPAPSSANTVQSESKEASQDSSKGPDPSKKKSASLDADGQSATDADGRVWVVGETMYGYDPSRKNEPIKYTIVGFKSMPNGDIRMIANDGAHDKEFGLVNQTPYLHKELPGKEQSDEQKADIKITTPTPETLMDDATNLATVDSDEVKKAETETNESREKMYYQTAIPEFDVDIAREWREAKGEDAKKSVIRKIKPFYDPNDPKKAGYKTLWEKLNTTWDAYTNAVKNVQVGDKVKFIANADAGEYNGKPVILMVVEKNGQRYIINVMRRTGNYAGLNAFLNEFDSQYQQFKSLHPGQEFVFDKESIVWGKRGGIVDYDYSPNYAGERAITEIPGYDEKAPIVWINGNAEFETLRGDINAARNVTSWRMMSDTQRRLSRGNVYYLAEDGLGGYIPIRLGIEHFTSENYENDNPKFNAIRESLMRIEGIAGNFFARTGMAVSDEEKNQILDEENARLHAEVAELRKMVNLTTGFFGLTFNKNGQPVLFYDRNASQSENRDRNAKFDGFFLGENGENNISKLVQIFAQENVALDFYPKHNLRSMIEDGFITSNAKKLLPKNVDVYIEHWNGKDFVPTEMQRRELEEEPVEEEPIDNGPSQPGGLFRRKDVEAGEYREEDTGFVFTADELADQPVQQKEITQEGTYSPWSALDDEQRGALSEYYEMTEEEFNEMSPEDREEILSCIGV